MRWFRSAPLKSSLSAFLGFSRDHSGSKDMAPIRQAMLDALGEDGAQLDPQLFQRLSTLKDAHALWYARSDLVAVLSQLHGEAKAVAMVQELQPVFKGVLPPSLTQTARAPR